MSLISTSVPKLKRETYKVLGKLQAEIITLTFTKLFSFTVLSPFESPSTIPFSSPFPPVLLAMTIFLTPSEATIITRILSEWHHVLLVPLLVSGAATMSWLVATCKASTLQKEWPEVALTSALPFFFLALFCQSSSPPFDNRHRPARDTNTLPRAFGGTHAASTIVAVPQPRDNRSSSPFLYEITFLGLGSITVFTMVYAVMFLFGEWFKCNRYSH